MKKNSFVFMGMSAIVLALGFVFISCATNNGGGGNSSDAFNLDKLLHKYMGPNPATWHDESTEFEVNVYFLDPLRFEEFKAELDASGEYAQKADIWKEENRDWDRGKAIARLANRLDGRGLALQLHKADNSSIGYDYEKVSQASDFKLIELLRKYMGPNSQTWDDVEVKVYFLDPIYFEAFKAELDAGGVYHQVDSWTDDDRDWDRGKAFARWAMRPDGNYELDLCRENNSRSGYRYNTK